MKTHEQIDRRGLELARLIVERIDADPERSGLEKARACCESWLAKGPDPVFLEWRRILDLPWEQVRDILLADTEEGRRLRQSSPFCGILSPQERWQVFKEFREHEAA